MNRQGGRYALVIACDRFTDPDLSTLSAPTHDARSLADVLQDPAIGGFTASMVVNRTSSEVMERIEQFFADRVRDDLLLLYFSGHGLKDDESRLHFAMTNSRLRLLGSTAVPASFVREQMERSRARQKVLLLDCCFGGAFAGNELAKADLSVHPQDALAASGSAVLTATDAIRYSFESQGIEGEVPESVFTRLVVEGLSSGAGDRDGDGDITLDELYDYVHDRMTSERSNQRPGKWEWDLHGRLVVARNARWVMPRRITDAIASPLPTFRLGAVEELSSLFSVGNDTVREQVKQSLAALTTDDSRSVAGAARAALRKVSGEEPGTGPLRAEEPGTSTIPAVPSVPSTSGRVATVSPPPRAHGPAPAPDRAPSSPVPPAPSPVPPPPPRSPQGSAPPPRRPPGVPRDAVPDRPPGGPRSSRPVAVVTLVALLVAAAALVVALLARGSTPSAGPAPVTTTTEPVIVPPPQEPDTSPVPPVDFSVTLGNGGPAGDPSGDCSSGLVFTATQELTASRAGTARYEWVDADGAAVEGPKKLVFDEAGTRSVTVSVTRTGPPGDTLTAVVRLHLLAPDEATGERIEFSTTCPAVVAPIDPITSTTP